MLKHVYVIKTVINKIVKLIIKQDFVTNAEKLCHRQNVNNREKLECGLQAAFCSGM